jgi:hypothetical protein
MVEAEDPAAIARQLADLRTRASRPRSRDRTPVRDRPPTSLTVKRLKKRKLWLKDCIARLESALIPDEPA